jgi:hypothetical protein
LSRGKTRPEIGPRGTRHGRRWKGSPELAGAALEATTRHGRGMGRKRGARQSSPSGQTESSQLGGEDRRGGADGAPVGHRGGSPGAQTSARERELEIGRAETGSHTPFEGRGRGDAPTRVGRGRGRCGCHDRASDQNGRAGVGLTAGHGASATQLGERWRWQFPGRVGPAQE